MTPPAIEESLLAAEAAVDAGRGLSGTGFWRAVASVKREPELIDRYADRIAAIDLAAFEQWALVKMPVSWGTALMALATAVGVGLVGWSYYTTGELISVVLFYLGLGVLLVTTHGLAHLLIGSALGMRFTHWFIGKITQPQPGVKVDYSTYLRARAVNRAWMHAGGAITTKLIPFALIGAAVAADLPRWAVWGLPVIGVAAIITDIVWSTRNSDWKKFRREMKFAQTP
ncbi:MAG: hypothetical protein ACRDU9_01290 [Acidimicrobiia bacterium]